MSFFLQWVAKFDKDTMFFQVYRFPKLQLEYHTLVNKTLHTNHTCSNLIPKREWFGRLIYLLLVWQVMSSCSQSRNYLTVPQIFSYWKDRHFHNRFTFVTWLNNMPLPSFSVLLGGNLTATNYTLTSAQIKVTHTLVLGNITLVPSAIAIHELQKIMSKNVKTNI